MTSGQVTLTLSLSSRIARFSTALFLLGTGVAQIPHLGRTKDQGQYGMGIIVNIPLPEAEVSQVVAEIAQNGIIRGTKEYNKDEYVTGAQSANSTPVFPAWTEDGKVVYKVKKSALDPRNFKNSGDVGTLVVRYVVQPQGDKNSVLRIDAVYVEDFRKTVHLSNGSVESSEYKDIQDHLASIELMKKETIEAEREKREGRSKPGSAAGNAGTQQGESSSLGEPSARPIEESAATGDQMPSLPEPDQKLVDSLEQHVRELRGQVERAIKPPGAPLKSAPFQTASTLKSLPSGTEVLLVILTPYWYGVETHDGDHGWISRDQLEPLP
jgi:hypothetical protein